MRWRSKARYRFNVYNIQGDSGPCEKSTSKMKRKVASMLSCGLHTIVESMHFLFLGLESIFLMFKPNRLLFSKQICSEVEKPPSSVNLGSSSCIKKSLASRTFKSMDRIVMVELLLYCGSQLLLLSFVERSPCTPLQYGLCVCVLSTH